jgi:hypothetical protein
MSKENPLKQALDFLMKDMSNGPGGPTAGAPDVTLRSEAAPLLDRIDRLVERLAGPRVTAAEIMSQHLLRLAAARIRELEAQKEWRPIKVYLRDGSEAVVYASNGREGAELIGATKESDGWWPISWDLAGRYIGSDMDTMQDIIPPLVVPVAEGRPAGPSVPDSSVPARTEGDV